jgi:hypothetical protein
VAGASIPASLRSGCSLSRHRCTINLEQLQITGLVVQGRLKDAIHAFPASDPLLSDCRRHWPSKRYTRLRSRRCLGILQFSGDAVTENQGSAVALLFLF